MDTSDIGVIFLSSFIGLIILLFIMRASMHRWWNIKADPTKCTVQGNGTHTANVFSVSSFVLKVVDSYGRSCVADSINAKLTSEVDGSTIPCKIQQTQASYEISYSPAIRGRHILNVFVNSVEIQGNPFRVFVTYPHSKVQGPVRVINTPECPNPNRITMDKQSHLVVSSWMSKVCVYRKDGTMLFTFGGEGKEDGKFSNANGVAVDDNGFIYVADWGNNRIQVFSPDGDGKFISSVGCSGNDLGQFNHMTGIGFNKGKLFACEYNNSRVQVADKSSGTFLFKYSFGTEGDGKLSQPEGIAFDSNGHVYVTDGKKDCVFVYNTDGTFIRHFGSTGDERGQLKKPTGIDIDRNDFVYVAERLNNRVSVFRTSGEFVTSFGSYGDDTPLDFVEPLGLTVDEDGFIYICDSINDRIQVF